MKKTEILIIGAAAGAVFGSILRPGIPEVLIVAAVLWTLVALAPRFLAGRQKAAADQ